MGQGKKHQLNLKLRRDSIRMAKALALERGVTVAALFEQLLLEYEQTVSAVQGGIVKGPGP
jgi:hypothetical protein